MPEHIPRCAREQYDFYLALMQLGYLYLSTSRDVLVNIWRIHDMKTTSTFPNEQFFKRQPKFATKRNVENLKNFTFFGPLFNWSWSSDIALAELSLVFKDLQVLRCWPSSTIQASAVPSGNNTVRVAKQGWCLINWDSLQILHRTTFDSVGRTKEDVLLVPSPVMSSHCGLVHSCPPWQVPRRALYGLPLEGSSV